MASKDEPREDFWSRLKRLEEKVNKFVHDKEKAKEKAPEAGEEKREP